MLPGRHIRQRLVTVSVTDLFFGIFFNRCFAGTVGWSPNRAHNRISMGVMGVWALVQAEANPVQGSEWISV